MIPSDIMFWKKAEPFRPFRIVTNGGRIYDVRLPELVTVLTGSLVYYTPSADEGVFQRGQMIGLSLIDRIEPLDAPPPPPEETPARKGKRK